MKRARVLRMEHHIRFTTSSRAKALEAGLWQKSDGTFIAVRTMADPHLVNALLKALANGDPPAITTPLSAEVDRRGLRDYALRVAAERMP